MAGSLLTSALAITTSSSIAVSAVADFGATANSFIDVLTPGASIVSAGGHDYSTPGTVPEPASLLLLGSGLAGLGAVAWTRRRRT